MGRKANLARDEKELINVLLVEDNPGDVRLIVEAFRDRRLPSRFEVVGDGIEALAYLHQEDTCANAPRPDLILLDLNLPRMDGRQVLHRVKDDANLRRIPVAVFTSSRAESEIAESYDLHANCYVTKPVGFDDFIEAVGGIADFWSSIVSLPGQEEDGSVR